MSEISPEFTPDQLHEQVAQLLECPPEAVNPDENLVLSGLGSLEMMRLVTTWRRHGLSVDLAAVVAEPTITAWSQLLITAQQPASTS